MKGMVIVLVLLVIVTGVQGMMGEKQEGGIIKNDQQLRLLFKAVLFWRFSKTQKLQILYSLSVDQVMQ